MLEREGVPGRVMSGGVELFYRRFGDGGRTPILIVHGLSYFSYDWIDAAHIMARDRQVAAMDMRGFGESGWSAEKNYKLDTLSADVIAVLDVLGWRKAVLMGHSFGGRVMLATSLWHQERAAAYVSVDFAPDLAQRGRRHVAERIGRQPDVFASFDEALAYHGDQNAAANSPLRKRWDMFLRKTEKGYVLKRDLYYRDQFRNALESGKSAPVPDFLWTMMAQIAIPALVVRASDSDMFEPQTLEKIRTLNPKVVCAQVAGSHNLSADNPVELAEVVNGFLSAVNL